MPQVIQGAIPRRLQEVAAHGFSHVEAVAAPPQLEHHILRNLLGRRALTEHRFRDAHEQPVVRAEYRVERTCLTGAKPGEQLTIVNGWSRRHRYLAPST